jgi:hypothetical protein
MTDTQHEYKNDVDKLMDRIHVAINLRLESDRIIHSPDTPLVSEAKLRQESDKLLRDAEYTLYELIDKALEVAP